MFVHVGFGNIVMTEKIACVLNPESAPVKRLIKESKESGLCLDATCGRRTRSVIVLHSDHVILAAIQPETVAERMENRQQSFEKDPED